MRLYSTKETYNVKEPTNHSHPIRGCASIYIYIYTAIHIYIYIYMSKYVHTSVHLHLCMYLFAYAYTYVHKSHQIFEYLQVVNPRQNKCTSLGAQKHFILCVYDRRYVYMYVHICNLIYILYICRWLPLGTLSSSVLDVGQKYNCMCVCKYVCM